jgi:hypothetical protein
VDLRSGALASIFCRCTLLVLKLTTAACLLKDDDLCKASKGFEHGIALIVTRHQGLIIIDELCQGRSTQRLDRETVTQRSVKSVVYWGSCSI